MSTIAVPTGMKTKTAASRNAGTTSTRIAHRRTGPAAPSPRWRKGIQAASPTSTTPAASARAPVTSLGVVPPSLTTWKAWRPPFTTASTPKVKATAARTPGRREGNRTTARTLATSAIEAASACWVSGTPPRGRRNASSSACRSAAAEAAPNTSASAERARRALAMRASSGARPSGVATGDAVTVVSRGQRSASSSAACRPRLRAAREQSGVPPGVARSFRGRLAVRRLIAIRARPQVSRSSRPAGRPLAASGQRQQDRSPTELRRALIHIRIGLKQPRLTAQAPQDLRANPGRVTSAFDAPYRSDVVGRGDRVVDLLERPGQQPVLVTRLHHLQHSIDAFVIRMLRFTRIHAQLLARPDDLERQVVVDVCIHPCDGELQRSYATIKTRLEQWRPRRRHASVRRRRSKSPEVCIAEIDVEIFEERRRLELSRPKVISHGDRDVEIQPVEPPHSVVLLEGGLQRLQMSDYVVYGRRAGHAFLQVGVRATRSSLSGRLRSV